jgi:hypothetical protein
MVSMAAELRRTYFKLLVPALLGFIGIFYAKKLNLTGYYGHPALQKLFPPLIFVLSVIFAVALPIVYRMLFVRKIRNHKNISEKIFIEFERSFLCITLTTPYITLTAYLLEIPRFHLAGTVLMGLYAVYYYYPSQKRVRFEKRIFRVK